MFSTNDTQALRQMTGIHFLCDHWKNERPIRPSNKLPITDNTRDCNTFDLRHIDDQRYH